MCISIRCWHITSQKKRETIWNAPYGVCLGYNDSSIDQLTQLEQELLHVEINREDYSEHEAIQNEVMEFEVNVPLTVFREGDLIAFRGSDG